MTTRQAYKSVDMLYQLRRFVYYEKYFPKLGLRKDDIIDENFDNVVAEALKRIPKEVRYERDFRLFRAAQLSMNKNILPKEEWTEYDKDESYLQPHVDEIKRELAEADEWKKRDV